MVTVIPLSSEDRLALNIAGRRLVPAFLLDRHAVYPFPPNQSIPS